MDHEHHHGHNFVIVKDRHPRISEVLNDCVNLCVPATRNESLASILQKMCAKIKALENLVSLEARVRALEEEVNDLENPTTTSTTTTTTIP